MRPALIPSAALALALLPACQGVIFMGNLAVLAVTFGIFMGTISLGRDR